MSTGTDHDECRQAIGDGIRKLKVATAELTEANATIAALREALGKAAGHAVAIANRAYPDSADHQDAEAILAVACANEKLDAQPLPPAAVKLLAERDAGRALFEALVAELDPHEGLARDVYGVVREAVEAYRKVVD